MKIILFPCLLIILCSLSNTYGQTNPIMLSNNEDEIFKIPEQMPLFPNCEKIDGTEEDKYLCTQKMMWTYIYKNLKYPKEAQDNGIEGKVIVKFVIEKDGSISNIQPTRFLTYGCTEAAIEVVQSMNNMPEKWIPGKQNEHPVRVSYTIPIYFRLEKIDEEKKIKPNNYKFELVKVGDGEEAKINDYVYFTAKVTDDRGKIVKIEKVEQVIQILDEYQDNNPFPKVIRKAKVGDVYKITIPKDSLFAYRNTNLKYLDYELCIKKVLNPEANLIYSKEQKMILEAKIAEYSKNIPEIENLLNKYLNKYRSNKLKLKTTKSGLKYHVLNSGKGSNAKTNCDVTINYYNALIDGKMIDCSYKWGHQFSFVLGKGEVISGLDEGIMLLNKGSRAILFIPAKLAYGETGVLDSIPPNSELIFYVEINDISDR